MPKGAGIFKFIILALLGFFLITYFVYALWNWLMPDIFNLKIISYWQAMGLLVLSKILISGFKGGTLSKQQWQDKRQYWKQRMEAKMGHMTPEEKEKCKEELAKKCGCMFDEN